MSHTLKPAILLACLLACSEITKSATPTLADLDFDVRTAIRSEQTACNTGIISSIEDLDVGDHVLLVCNSYQFSGIDSSKTYGSAAEYTTIPAQTHILEVQRGYLAGKYALYDLEAEAYLAYSGTTSGIAYSKTKDDPSSSSWTITITDGVATVRNCKDDSRLIRFHTTNIRFACYFETFSNTEYCQLYKICASDETPDVSVSGEGETPAPKSWSKAFVATPTMENVVELSNVAMTIPVGTTAQAQQVILKNNASLTIEPGAALIVAENITREDDTPTTAEDLHIQSSSAGNGALIWGTSGTPGDATVEFYTKSHGTQGSSASVNQYIGTPFSNTPTVVSQYNNAWVYDATTEGGTGDLYWKKMEANDLLNAWEGYNLITAEDAGYVYQMQGTLVSNADVTLTALYYNGGDASNVNNENLLANSWVAPIRIAAFDAESDFSGVEATIYIFNAGSPDQSKSAQVGEPGNYTAYSVETAGDDDVIPSMQSFSVYTTGSTPSLTLNYDQLVKAPALASFVNASNRAPRRANTVAEEMERLQLRVEGENGWADELKIYTHPDFSTSFENGWDAHKLYGYPQAPQLYARTEDGDMAIHCVPEIDAIRLGFQSGSEDDTYTFSFDYHGSEPLYLIDCQPEDATQESVSTLITADSRYTFHPGAPAEQERFLISSAPKMPTGSVSPEADQLRAKPRKLLHNGQLLILRDGKTYTITGQKL